MASANDLVGLGLPPALAEALGYTPNTVTCAGTAQTTATTVKTTNTTLSAASSQTGAILPSNAPNGTIFYFYTSSSTGAVVYVPVGHTMINAAAATSAANGSFTLAQYKSGLVWKASQTTTVGVWVSLVSA